MTASPTHHGWLYKHNEGILAAVHRGAKRGASVLTTNTALDGVLLGTPVTPALAADSMVLSNLVANGDILIAANNGGNSQAWLWVDSSAGTMTLYGAGTAALVVSAAAVTSSLAWNTGADGAGVDSKLFGGTASCYLEYDASEDRLNVIQTNAATTGVETTASIQQTHTGIGASAEALEAILTSNVAFGTYANAIFGKVDLSSSGEVTGLIGVICAEMTMPDTDAPAAGTYAAFEAEFNMAGADVGANPVVVTYVNVWGGNETEFDDQGLLFDIAGVSTGDGKFFRTNAVALNNCDAFLKCRVNGTVYYIPLSDNQAGT